jgi:hypothetical protein
VATSSAPKAARNFGRSEWSNSLAVRHGVLTVGHHLCQLLKLALTQPPRIQLSGSRIQPDDPQDSRTSSSPTSDDRCCCRHPWCARPPAPRSPPQSQALQSLRRLKPHPSRALRSRPPRPTTPGSQRGRLDQQGCVRPEGSGPSARPQPDARAEAGEGVGEAAVEAGNRPPVIQRESSLRLATRDPRPMVNIEIKLDLNVGDLDRHALSCQSLRGRGVSCQQSGSTSEACPWSTPNLRAAVAGSGRYRRAVSAAWPGRSQRPVQL